MSEEAIKNIEKKIKELEKRIEFIEAATGYKASKEVKQ